MVLGQVIERKIGSFFGFAGKPFLASAFESKEKTVKLFFVLLVVLSMVLIASSLFARINGIPMVLLFGAPDENGWMVYSTDNNLDNQIAPTDENAIIDSNQLLDTNQSIDSNQKNGQNNNETGWQTYGEQPEKECEAACGSDADCDDANPETTDICTNAGTCEAKCENTSSGLEPENIGEGTNGKESSETEGIGETSQGAAGKECSIACSLDSDCDDNIAETIDECKKSGTCEAKCKNRFSKESTKCSLDIDCDDGDSETIDACDTKKQKCVNQYIDECGKECDFAESQNYGTQKFKEFEATNKLLEDISIKLLPEGLDFSIETNYRQAESPPAPNSYDLGYSPTKIKQEIEITNNSSERQTKIVQLQFLSNHLKFRRNEESFDAEDEPKQLMKEERLIEIVLPGGETETVKETIPPTIAFLNEAGEYAGYYDWSDLADYNAVVTIKKTGEQAFITTTFAVTIEPNSKLLIDPTYDLIYTANAADSYFVGGAGDDQLGFGGVAWGDADEDGKNDDLILQSYKTSSKNGLNTGAAYLILNAGLKKEQIDLNNLADYDANFIGSAASDALGHGDVAFGDADADGYNDDLILQAYAADPAGRNSAGVAYLILHAGVPAKRKQPGRQIDMKIPTDYDANFLGAKESDFLGFNGVAFGDADEDGYNDDLILQAYAADPAGRSSAGVAYLILNAGSKTLQNDLLSPASYDANFIGSTASDFLGYGGVAFGDADADGNNDDLILQAYAAHSKNGVDVGVAYLILHAGVPAKRKQSNRQIDMNIPTNYDANYIGGAASDALGQGGVAFGDADADGYNDDLIVQASLAQSKNGTDTGAAYLILNAGAAEKLGERDLNNGANYDANFIGEKANDTLGFGGVAFGDVDEDGYNDDLILQAYLADPVVSGTARANAGVAYLILDVNSRTAQGQIDLLIPTNYDANFIGGANGDALGYGGVAFGDVDEDGYNDDLILQAYLTNPVVNGGARADAGIAYLFDFDMDLNVLCPINDSFTFVGGATIDLNFFITDSNSSFDMNIDINYSTSATEGTGTVIVDDWNLALLNCDSNTAIKRRCKYAWDTTGVPTKLHYYIIAKIFDGGQNSDFNAGDGNFEMLKASISYKLSSVETGGYDVNFLGGEGGTYGDHLGSGGGVFADIDGDGRKDDLLLQAYQATAKIGGDAGVAYLFLNPGTRSRDLNTGEIDLAKPTPYSMNCDANFGGGASSSLLGWGEAAWGDADADGRNDDLILQAYAADPKDPVSGIARTDAGVAYLILDVNSRLEPPGHQQLDMSILTDYDANFYGGAAGDYLGYGEAVFGDADADGYNDDLILQSYKTSSKNGLNTGVAYLILNVGTKTGLIDLNNGANYDANFIGVAATDGLGISGVAFGDIDGEGYNDDLILQAYAANPKSRTDAGAAYLILDVNSRTAQGQIDLSDPANYDANFIGAVASDALGRGGVAFGDADADGNNDDLILQAYAAHSKNGADTGVAYLILDVNSKTRNPATGISGEVDLLIPANYDANFIGPATSAYLGYGGVAFGDANADGYNDDLILQSYNVGGGRAYLILNAGSKTGQINLGVSTDYDANFIAGTTIDMLGFDGVDFGDADADGYNDDLILTAKNTVPKGRTNAGMAYLFDLAPTPTDVNVLFPINGSFAVGTIIDLNFFITDSNSSFDMNIDINYSTSATEGTGIVIANDLNLALLKCDSNTALQRTCKYSWDTTGVTANNYYIIAKVFDARNASDFNAGDGTFAITGGVTDSCSCPASGWWEIINSDICTLATSCTLTSGGLHIIDGNLTILNTKQLTIPTTYKIIIENNEKLFIEKGGKLVINK